MQLSSLGLFSCIANDTKLGLAVNVNIVKDTGNMQSFKKNLQNRCLTEATQGTNPLFVSPCNSQE